MAKKRKGQTFLLLVELWLIGLNTSLKKVKGSDLQGKNDMDWVMCLERKHPELFDGNENYSKTPPEKVKKMMRQPGPFSRSSFQLFRLQCESSLRLHGTRQ